MNIDSGNSVSHWYSPGRSRARAENDIIQGLGLSSRFRSVAHLFAQQTHTPDQPIHRSRLLHWFDWISSLRASDSVPKAGLIFIAFRELIPNVIREVILPITSQEHVLEAHGTSSRPGSKISLGHA